VQYFVCEEDRKLACNCKQKFDFSNLKIRFHKHKVSFLVVKTVNCKRGIDSVPKMLFYFLLLEVNLEINKLAVLHQVHFLNSLVDNVRTP